jgi:hypothetical protein
LGSCDLLRKRILDESLASENPKRPRAQSARTVIAP